MTTATCICRHHLPTKVERQLLETIREANEWALAATTERSYQSRSDTANRLEARAIRLQAERLRKASRECPAAQKQQVA